MPHFLRQMWNISYELIQNKTYLTHKKKLVVPEVEKCQPQEMGHSRYCV